MLRESGILILFYSKFTHSSVFLVQRFSQEVVAPKVREMDENEMMDPSIIKGLFDQGVSF
jgi:hypothetical protein